MVFSPLAVAAQTTTPQAQATQPLAPGNAAGVKEAQGFGNVPIEFWIGAALVLTAAILVLAQDDEDVPTVSTTTFAP